jgi:predicted ATPase
VERSLIWIEGDVNGWSCSNCAWRFPVPTLLTADDAMAAYDRLAGAKFREHKCEAATSPAATKPERRQADTDLEERCRALIKRGYKPKVAVELVLQETEIEHGHDPKFMEKARAATGDFLVKLGKGLI